MVYRDPKYGLPAAQDTDVVKTWPTLSRELVDDLAGLFSGSDTFTSWVPTLAGFTASAVDCVYRKSHGGLVVATCAFTVTAVTATSTFTLPVAALRESIGDAYLVVAGNGYLGNVRVAAGTTTANLIVSKTDDVYAKRIFMSPGAPGSWAAGDKITGTLVYQAAAL